MDTQSDQTTLSVAIGCYH